MIYSCCDKLRRDAVSGSALNGIDFLEVLDHDEPVDSDRQRFIYVHLINDPGGTVFTRDNIRIDGGVRIRNIQVIDAPMGVGPQAKVITVEVDQPGDFSIYTLRLVRGLNDDQPPIGFDPRLVAIEFSFKVECQSDFDCKPRRVCIEERPQPPQIDYLAKDYASFRRQMLDRMALLMPAWRERNAAADLGIALVELLAYVGDHLSYQQDAIATEAYLNTARKRISVRRHARLVDYFMSDGCNARTWVQIEVNADVLPLNPGDPPVVPAGTLLFTRIPGQGAILPNDPRILERAEIAFETIHIMEELYKVHNSIPFYTWSNERCCLPIGATEATLLGHFPNLKDAEGDKDADILVFEEVLGPKTGESGDADPAHRHAVRLTKVRAFDASGDPLVDPLTGDKITEISWAEDDALPFALCLSARTDEDHGLQYIEDVSVARGNIVLADHGLTIENEDLGEVPQPRLYYAPEFDRDPCSVLTKRPITPRFHPRLQESPLTHAAPYNSEASASAAMRWDLRDVEPGIRLNSDEEGGPFPWYPQRDLLNSDATAREFVVEIEEDGSSQIRFGDNQRGRRADAGTRFTAIYRVGNGTTGNIGADVLVHIRSDHVNITRVRNLLPGKGGRDPESIKDVRHRAPVAFRTQERAVTPEDCEDVTERLDSVQQAAASFHWTGSWYTVFLTVDRKGGEVLTQKYEQSVRDHVERFRMAGYDLEVDEPRYVPLEIEMQVCVKTDYFRSDVKAALEELFSNRRLPDGRLGLFHPDNFTFGQTVYLSPLYEAAQSVDGVASVYITTFQHYGRSDTDSRDTGKLEMDRLEIARLDNDPNFAENGVFQLEMLGGK